MAGCHRPRTVLRDPDRDSVLALAYVMNVSGQAATIGHFVEAAGAGPAPELPAAAKSSEGVLGRTAALKSGTAAGDVPDRGRTELPGIGLDAAVIGGPHADPRRPRRPS
jgi:lactate permease